MHAFDRQTDGRTDRQTEISSLDRVYIPRSAVKSITALELAHTTTESPERLLFLTNATLHIIVCCIVTLYLLCTNSTVHTALTAFCLFFNKELIDWVIPVDRNAERRIRRKKGSLSSDHQSWHTVANRRYVLPTAFSLLLVHRRLANNRDVLSNINSITSDGADAGFVYNVPVSNLKHYYYKIT